MTNTKGDLKTEKKYEANYKAMKAWNEQRFRNEEEGFKKFWERKAMFADWAKKYPNHL